MGKSAPAAPQPIDPTKTIAAQTQSNEATARLQQQLGMIGTYGPGGSVTYQADPNSPAGYNQVTNLSPEQRAIYDAQTQAQQGALNTANSQIGRINTALGQSFTPPQMQTSFDPGGSIQSTFDQGPNLRFGFDPGGQVQTSVGPTDFSADRQAVTDSTFAQARAQLDPMWDQAQDKERVRLANQGLSQNSSAYQTAQGNFDQARNNAYNDAAYRAVQAGSDQQQRLFDQSVTKGQFANSATGQQYERNLGQANFENMSAGQQFGQNQSAAGFGNAAAQQQYDRNMSMANFGNTGRQQDYQNLAYSQNLPIEQFATLMGTGGGVSMPTAYNGPVAGVSPTDVLGSYALYDQGRQANYAQQVANINSRNQAVGGLAGAVMGNWQNIFPSRPTGTG